MSSVAKLPTVPTMRIEKDVPLPQKPTVYPFAEMEIGDSFFTNRPRNTVASAASGWAKHHGSKFATRKIDGGTRVWRIA